MTVKVIFLAPPAAGKGTQATLLKEYADILHLSTGDVLREAICNKTELGTLAEECVASGKFVSDEIILKIVDSVMSNSGKSGWILDGFPRQESQALALDNFLEKRNDNLDKVVHFEVSDQTLLERVNKRQSETGRPDDELSVYMKRLEAYRQLTAPLIRIYEDRGILIRINGEQNVNDVFSDLKASLQI